MGKLFMRIKLRNEVRELIALAIQSLTDDISHDLDDNNNWTRARAIETLVDAYRRVR